MEIKSLTANVVRNVVPETVALAATAVPAVVTLPGPVTVPVACQAVSAAESAVLYRPVKLLARTNLT